MGRGRILASAIAALVAAGLLSGCTAGKFGAGASAWGSNKLAVAEITGLGDYTVDRAMAEARKHFRNDNYGHSAALYKRAVELAPNSAEGYVGLGASYDRLRRFDLSDRVYAALHKLSGDTAQYYNNLGYSYMLRGNLREALQSFRRAHAIDPDNIVVANNLQLLANVAASQA